MARMQSTIRTGIHPSITDFDGIPRRPFALVVEAHGVVVTFAEVVVSKGAYAHDRAIEAELVSIETMVDGSGKEVVDELTLKRVRVRLRKLGIYDEDATAGGYNCYRLIEDARNRAVALREFARIVVDAIATVVKPAPVTDSMAVLPGFVDLDVPMDDLDLFQANAARERLAPDLLRLAAGSVARRDLKRLMRTIRATSFWLHINVPDVSEAFRRLTEMRLAIAHAADQTRH